METHLTVALAVISVLCIILAVKVIVMKKTAREIENGMKDILSGDTNRQITVSTGDRQMCFLASALNSQLADLRSKRLNYENGDRELRQAITNIAHDLRTPLTAILGYTQMAQSEENGEKTNEYLSIIESRTIKMKELTSELFSYALLTSRSNELTLIQTDIRSVLEDSIAENYVLLTENSIFPEIEIPDAPVIKGADRNALQRVFSNIISNASKYSDGDLCISMKESGEIVFSNSAKKLTKIDAGRLFDRFFTVENGSNSTGLGLSIAKTLTEKMNGRINAEYKDGRLYIVLNF